ncbi:Predicted ester cyclase [Limimonas halophila]|uniref:Predicted ester cyclase n=1 Tax=Limimonas halophila TaxID=1082479 RepID=A0A1G7R913_9PROT|nr:ester cyclase [Limimonas halophila]SDG07135.1 Predicted ester cyclase [Limimonas halophila]
MRTLTVRFYEDAWNRADESAARAILSPSVRFKGTLSEASEGPESVLRYMRGTRAVLTGFRCIIDDLVVEEPRAAARLTFTGTHVGTLLGAPPTGRQVTWSGAGFFTAARGRLSEIWVVGDIESLRAQLYATP